MHYEFTPGAREFLLDLKAHGVKCALVTSSNQKKMESVLKQVPDFPSLFDRILTSEDFTASKPAPDCYLLGARVLGADIAESVVFEDAFNVLAAGMASGIFTIGMTTNNPAEAIRVRCNYVIPYFAGLDYEKLVEIMKNHH
jgi:HAD superfamily hydrolase (TIGR01509 family)